MGTIIHLHIQKQEAWLAVSEIPTSPGHEDARVHLHIPTRNIHHIADALGLQIDTLSLGKRRQYIRSVRHPQSVRREGEGLLLYPKTVLLSALKIHQEGTRK